jgi:hypothetical protein
MQIISMSTMVPCSTNLLNAWMHLNLICFCFRCFPGDSASAFASQYSMYSDVSLCSYIFLFFIVVMASLPSDGSNGVDDLLFHLNGSFDFFSLFCCC